MEAGQFWTGDTTQTDTDTDTRKARDMTQQRLMHHSSEDYDIALGRMSDNVGRKFEATIAKGRDEAQKLLRQLDDEYFSREDEVLAASRLDFVPTGNGVEVLMETSKGEVQRGIHDHAFRQLCQRSKMNMKFARSLQDMAGEARSEDDAKTAAWATELLAHNLNKLYTEGPASKSNFLARSVGTQLRGFLSDHYRCLDSRPLLAAFFGVAVRDCSAVPTRAYGLETKTALRVVLPQVFMPIPNQPMLYGLEWSNSDYGHGGHNVRGFIHQPFCTNECTKDDVLRQVHRGRQLDEGFAYSRETYELDQKTSVSALKDTIKGLLAPASVKATMDTISQAYEEKIDPKKLPAMLKALRKSEVEQVKESFTSTDIENMSPGQNRWRLSNAISFVATQTEDKYRALELERMSGKVAGIATRATVIED